jgi:hypothetical protein
MGVGRHGLAVAHLAPKLYSGRPLLGLFLHDYSLARSRRAFAALDHKRSVATAAEKCNPVRRDSVGGTWDGLIFRMAFGRGECGSVVILVGVVVPEPVLARFEGPDDRMPGLPPMRRRVSRQRVVATPDVPACRAAAQVDPPAANGIAFDASGATRRNCRIHRGAHT